MPVLFVGSKSVLETGSFMITGTPSWGLVHLHGLSFHFRVLASQDPPTARIFTEGNNVSVINIVGLINVLPLAWNFPNVAYVNGQPTDLMFTVQSFGQGNENDAFFAISYTFAQTTQGVPPVTLPLLPA